MTKQREHCRVHPAIGLPYPCPLCIVAGQDEPKDEVPFWTPNENPAYEEYEGNIEEFWAYDVQGVHFEALDQSQWYMTVILRNGQTWQLKFGACNPNAKGYAFAERVR